MEETCLNFEDIIRKHFDEARRYVYWNSKANTIDKRMRYVAVYIVDNYLVPEVRYSITEQPADITFIRSELRKVLVRRVHTLIALLYSNDNFAWNN